MNTGPVAYRITQLGEREIRAQAWGPGADELITGLPALLGAQDTPEEFDPRHPLVDRTHHRHPGLRIPRTGRILEALLPAVLEQRVVSLDASAAWFRLLRRHGEPAPGPAPAGMRVLPDAAAWERVPSWHWHEAGVDPRRARAFRTALPHVGAMQRAHDRNPADPAPIYRRLRSLPGIGVWTAAQIGHRALGDPDAAPIGDYHLPGLLGHVFTGAPLPEDQVETFLEPWRPHRYRLVRLLELTPGARAPRRAPRMSRQDHRFR
jgi:3-methyladenine DNA glycosylase/8-oxoguanine DNA glycosylase